MKKILTSAVALLLAATLSAQEDSFFEPYKSISLRLPSVPLITNDPYISFWSPYDKLTDGTTRHWSDINKPMDGLLRVDGKVYRWMGKQQDYVLGNALLPMRADAQWSAKAYIGATLSSTNWTKEDFDESEWTTMPGAFGCPKGKYDNGTKECGDDWHTNVGTEWYEEGTNVYVRRHVTLTAEDLEKDLYVKYSHDDYFYLYVNGKLLVKTDYTWAPNEVRRITGTAKAALHEGDNVIAVRCYNKTGGAYCDFGIYENLKTNKTTETIATQTNVDVLACNTYYNFKCGSVNLDVVFTAPMIIDDLESISTPINYVSYRVTSNDGKEHDVQFYYGLTPEMAVYSDTQATTTRVYTRNNVTYAFAGTKEQKILGRTGDLIGIDWGYIYLPAIGGDVYVASFNDAESEFAADGKISTVKGKITQAANISQYPVLAFIKDLGTTTSASGYMMVGYDERYDIKYFGTNYKGYWARDGKTIYTAFEEMRDNYTYNMKRARDMDKIIYDDAYNASNSKKYAELLSGTYRHCLAAHKLFEDKEGNLLYFSKENNSNGCVNTVDLTYPSSSIFLSYNPALQKGMITSIIEYCYTGRWPYNFAAHDLGTYPHANGNVYGNPAANDGSTMPLEESANVIILAAYIAKQDGDLDYLRKYWDVLTSWNQFLVDNGKEPGNQLCTDDFKGSSTRNANLAVKAIMGIASFAEMCKMLGYDDLYEQHMATAREYSHYWVDKDRSEDGTWYYMEFENSTHWGLKYNMLWDKLWGWNLFNDDYTGDVMAVEIPYYKKKAQTWGLPLDSRDMTGKSDWNAWIAAMTTNQTDFDFIMDREWKFANECTTRWPLSDWHWMDNPTVRGFRARSVIGGLWAKVLVEKNKGTLPEVETGIRTTNSTNADVVEVSRYNLSGQLLSKPEKGINIVKYSNGVTRKETVR